MWQVEAPPKQVAFVEPEYPSQARRMGVEGSVVVRYLVDQSGQVEQMMVLEGPELLREASLHAVGRFVYEPVRHRGRAVKVWMRQVITFRLE
jgi:protein TonB